MKRMKTLEDLLAHEMKDLYSAEKQITKALPKMIKGCTNEDLRQALENHLEETEHQILRLEECMGQLGIPTRGAKCAAMEGLIEEGEEILEADMESTVRDAAIIAACQRVEHYEMAGYGCARTFAKQLGNEEAASLLQHSLDEEKNADVKLTQLAMDHINFEAHAGAGA
jgi:ferritin-like metal-binding protein YciE